MDDTCVKFCIVIDWFRSSWPAWKTACRTFRASLCVVVLLFHPFRRWKVQVQVKHMYSIWCCSYSYSYVVCVLMNDFFTLISQYIHFCCFFFFVFFFICLLLTYAVQYAANMTIPQKKEITTKKKSNNN